MMTTSDSLPLALHWLPPAGDFGRAAAWLRHANEEPDRRRVEEAMLNAVAGESLWVLSLASARLPATGHVNLVRTR